METHELDDRMESFFLAETTKYLFLLFDEDNFIHKQNRNHSFYTPSNEEQQRTCHPASSGYLFNTEAHPLDLAAIRCCEHKHQNDSLYFTRSRLKVDHGCKRRPHHKSFYGFGNYAEDKYSLFDRPS